MKNKLFDKKNTLLLHGIAILMMIYHHLFVSGNNWFVNEGKSLFDGLNFISIGKADTFQMTVAWFCKICVAVFAFTSGYGMFIQLSGKNQDLKSMYRYCAKRLWAFYRQYLLCFLFFTGCEFLTGNNNGFDYSLSNYLLNLLGLRSTFNATWWYVSVYYCMILSSPIIYSVLIGKIEKKNLYLMIASLILLVALYFGYAFIIKDFEHYFIIFKNLAQSALVVYMIIFAEGMACARFSILEYLAEKLNQFSAFLILILTFVLRSLVIRIPGDSVFDIIFIVPFVLSVSCLFSYSNYLSKLYIFIGRFSSYLWYSHPYFYAFLFFGLVMRSDMSLLVYLQVVVYSLFASVIFDFVEKNLNRLLHHEFVKEN